ncbi:MAG: hypothetical protein ABS69_13495 [Nitrosomonadales bacterium SCN 54-20]|nr:MAG: hypothetical protein ABS69_13495 [Nitrosomonadales bacterium SCN 54-20]
MIVAMVIMRIVKMASYQVIHMISVRHGFVTTVRAVYMSLRVTFAFMSRSTALGVGLTNVYDMLIDMVAVRVVQMAIMKVADMVIVGDASVTAFRTVGMGMIFMLWQDTIRVCHCAFLLLFSLSLNKVNRFKSCRIQITIKMKHHNTLAFGSIPFYLHFTYAYRSPLVRRRGCEVASASGGVACNLNGLTLFDSTGSRSREIHAGETGRKSICRDVCNPGVAAVKSGKRGA